MPIGDTWGTITGVSNATAMLSLPGFFKFPFGRFVRLSKRLQEVAKSVTQRGFREVSTLWRHSCPLKWGFGYRRQSMICTQDFSPKALILSADIPIPLQNSIQHEVSQHPDFPAMSSTAFFYLLKTIGFRALKKSKSRDCMMIEDPRIIKRRRQYLEDKFKFMAEQRPIFYVDESYVLADHSVPKALVWYQLEDQLRGQIAGPNGWVPTF